MAVTRASLMLFRNRRETGHPIMMPSVILPGARIVLMLAHVISPSSTGNARLIIATVGSRPSVTYSRKARRVPVRTTETVTRRELFAAHSPTDTRRGRMVSW